MPVLQNQKQERFALEFAKGQSAQRAYKLAGYKAVNGVASAAITQLLNNINVKNRITELRQPVIARTQITLESLTEMYLEDRRDAKAAGQTGVARLCADSLGKLYGLFIERHEHGGVGDFERMSDDALRNLARKALIIEGKVNKPEPENNGES